MKILSRDELGILVQSQGNPAASIYMPTHRTGDTEQDPIRLKNLLREAEEQLINCGLRVSDTGEFLEPVYQLLLDSYFWQHQSDGLAIFRSPEMFRYYRLPYSFDELVVITERFHIKPLLPLFSQDGIFYVLAVSQNQVRLLQCTRHYVREVTPRGVPTNLSEALKYDQPEKQQQFHTTGPGGSIITHGHGVSKDYDKVGILHFFQKVDRGLHEALREEHAPLIIAAVDYLHPLYHEANTYQHLLDEGIQGNPDGLSQEVLQERALSIAQPYFEHSRASALEQYGVATAKGLATNDTKQAILAAYDGRVSTLFVAIGVQQWGQFDAEHRKVRLYEKEGPGIEDLLDLAAAHTLMNGGTVYAVESDEVPGERQAAALLRY